MGHICFADLVALGNAETLWSEEGRGLAVSHQAYLLVVCLQRRDYFYFFIS
jgi:hypothetical protein